MYASDRRVSYLSQKEHRKMCKLNFSILAYICVLWQGSQLTRGHGTTQYFCSYVQSKTYFTFSLALLVSVVEPTHRGCPFQQAKITCYAHCGHGKA